MFCPEHIFKSKIIKLPQERDGKCEQKWGKLKQKAPLNHFLPLNQRADETFFYSTDQKKELNKKKKTTSADFVFSFFYLQVQRCHRAHTVHIKKL